MTNNQRFVLSGLLVAVSFTTVKLYPTIAGDALIVVLLLSALAIAAFDERISAMTVRNRRRGYDEPLLRPSKGKMFSWLSMALPVTIWAMQWAEMAFASNSMVTTEVWGRWFFDHGDSPLLFLSGLVGILCRRSENG